MTGRSGPISTDELRNITAQALQDYWDAFVGDTGCIPSEFRIEVQATVPLVFADFTAYSGMSEAVAQAIAQRLAEREG